MERITRKVWQTFIETSQKRAEYIYHLNGKHEACHIYLDIGAGLCTNTMLFGKNAKQTIALDLKVPKQVRNKSLNHIIADAAHLPFQQDSVDIISLFSVIEHVPRWQKALTEAFQVLKRKGVLLMEVPNPYFPVDSHSGIPFLSYLPRRLRSPILKAFNYQWLNDIDTPTFNQLLRILMKIVPNSTIQTRKVVYPASIIIQPLQPIFVLLRKIGFFSIIPFGYFLSVKT